jgi:integral membrane protein
MEYFSRTKDKLVRGYDQLNDIFTDKEAWSLFRWAAFLETISWSLLITGIVFKVLRLPAYDYVLPIFGSIHGIFFIYYILIVFFVHRSMNWSFWRFVVAEAVSNVPFGALIFEMWLAKRRKPHTR